MSDTKRTEDEGSRDARKKDVESTMNKNEAVDSVRDALNGDSDSIKALTFIAAAYVLATLFACGARYFATKWAMKSAIRESFGR